MCTKLLVFYREFSTSYFYNISKIIWCLEVKNLDSFYLYVQLILRTCFNFCAPFEKLYLVLRFTNFGYYFQNFRCFILQNTKSGWDHFSTDASFLEYACVLQSLSNLGWGINLEVKISHVIVSISNWSRKKCSI